MEKAAFRFLSQAMGLVPALTSRRLEHTQYNLKHNLNQLHGTRRK